MPCRRWLVSAALLVSLAPLAPAAAPGADVGALLHDADRFAWLTNWGAAHPLYVSAENAALAARDRRAATYARFGLLRAEMQTRPLGTLSEELALKLAQPFVSSDSRLRLRGLTVKGDIDLEWDVLAAHRDWQQVRNLARELGDAAWENRANGELGMVAFLRGNTGEATKAVQQALDTARKLGDIGGELRYLSAIGNGLVMAGYLPVAAGFVDRALALARSNPDTGFPFVATSTKILTLIELKQYDEAERFARAALAEARVGDRRIKEIELRTMLASIAEARTQPAKAIEHLEAARAAAETGQVQRLLAEAEARLAQAYQKQGDLVRAAQRASSAVVHTRAAGSRFTLPIRLGELAAIRAAQGRPDAASALYAEASDVVEGIMANVPSRAAQARLVGVMSDLYAGHFVLASDRLSDPYEAFRVIERARGRALADVLRTLPDDSVAREDDGRARAVSALQLKLMTAPNALERRRLLERLWETEQLATVPGTQLAAPRTRLPATGRVAVAALQRILRPREILLEYVLLPSGSYCLILTPRALRLVRLPGRADIEPLAAAFRKEVQAGRVGQDSSERAALRRAIIEPLNLPPSAATEVVVVPDGVLNSIPFEQLLISGTAPMPSVTLAPSATVLALMRGRQSPRSTDRAVLAVGGVPYERLSGAKASSTGPVGFYDAAMPPSLPNLPGSAEEAKTVSGLFGQASTSLIGDSATEAALKQQSLKRYEVLHLAAHGFADTKFPERAALVLLGDARAGEDGLLQPREIARYNLHARLVVLSACDTAVGPTLGQEGVVNLARAFFVAGAGAVMTSLWQVDDTLSAALMRAFYGNLVRGETLTDGLRLAKRELGQRFGAKASATLGAFQLIGDGSQRLNVGAGSRATGGGGGD
jgi:CHAT domain-containing protein/tetratricopeptide (TPR) repeat protein